MKTSHEHVLAIEASTEQCSVALSSDTVVTFETSDIPKSHGKVLLPMIDALLEQRHVAKSQLSAIAVSTGPGSFTGIRIALSVAQGLGYGLDIPLIGANSLEIMAFSMMQKQQQNALAHGECGKAPAITIIPALDARMGEVYWSAYELSEQGLVETCKPQVSSPEVLNNHLSSIAEPIGCGHGWLLPDVRKDCLSQCETGHLPHAEALLHWLAEKKEESVIGATKFSDTQVEPLYLRNEVTWDKRKRIRQGKLV